MNNKKIFLTSCLAVDYETTHLKPEEAEIIEEGLSLFNVDDGVWSIAHEQLFDCKADTMTPEASASNNITKDMLSGYSVFASTSSCLHDPDNLHLPIASHNSIYDSVLFKKYTTDDEYENLKKRWLCTLRMAKKLYINDKTFKQFNLQYLRYRLELPVVDVSDIPHRAGYDAYVTGLLLSALVDEMEARDLLDTTKPYFPQIKQWTEDPIEIEFCNFGKYEDQPLKDVPVSYWKWCFAKTSRFDINSSDYDPDLAIAVYNILPMDYWSQALDSDKRLQEDSPSYDKVWADYVYDLLSKKLEKE